MQVQTLSDVTLLFAGDSGDGMQLTGEQFSLATALAHNDLATFPDFPAEIRAPQGTTFGVSAFQVHFSDKKIHTPGDEVDLLVAMNPAALMVNLHRLKKGGTIIVNQDSFEKRDLDLAKLTQNPLETDQFAAYQVHKVSLNKLTQEALKDAGLDKKSVDRCKNMFALGMALWLFSRPIAPVETWIRQKFSKKPAILEANLLALKKGMDFGETTETFSVRYEVPRAILPEGTYRSIHGNKALAYGLIAAAEKSGLELFYGSYPITPASDLLHELSNHKNFGVKTFQAEDELAAVGAAIGASFGGSLAVTGTSGPGLALKMEAIGLAVMTELPLVIVDVQRGGPSTGLPTKTEQADLLQALYGRNSEAPVCVLAAASPGDCFEMAYEACRIAVKYMVPVILLSDGYIGNGAEPWKIPNLDDFKAFEIPKISEPNAEKNGTPSFMPYKRDEKTLARPWAVPGIAGLEHRIGGLEKANETGNVSYDPLNHEFMVKLRAEKVQRIAQEIQPTEIIGKSSGDVLVIGWGGTYGAITSAVEQLISQGVSVSAIHLRHLNPLPPDLAEIFAQFKHLVVPELNNGQLVRVLRDAYGLPFVGLNKIQGLPFKISEIEEKVLELTALPETA